MSAPEVPALEKSHSRRPADTTLPQPAAPVADNAAPQAAALPRASQPARRRESSAPHMGAAEAPTARSAACSASSRPPGGIVPSPGFSPPRRLGEGVKGGEIMMPTRIGSSHRPAASVHPPAGFPMSASQRQRVRSHPRGVEFGSWIWAVERLAPPRRYGTVLPTMPESPDREGLAQCLSGFQLASGRASHA